MFELRNVDTKLLREQRDALLTSIDDADDFAQYGDSETRDIREKQIHMLDGLIGMIDDILDAIEVVLESATLLRKLYGCGSTRATIRATEDYNQRFARTSL